MKKAIRQYLTWQESMGRSPATLCAYRRRLRYLADHAGVSDLVELTEEHVRQYLDDLVAGNLKPSTRAAYTAAASAFLRWAHKEGLLLSDLARSIELPKARQKLPPAPLSRAQVEKLLELPDPLTVTGKRDRAVLEVLYGCGLRRSELIGLDVGDVDHAERSVLIRGKGGRERLVPIHDRALAALRLYWQSRGGRLGPRSPAIAAHEGSQARRISGPGLSMIFRRLSKKLGIHVHPHLLRHTCACHLVMGGADVRHVQLMLGHASIATTSRYLGLVKQELLAAYDRGIERMLEGEQL